MVETKQIHPLPSDELRRLQLTELELLIEFDRICRKNNIKYTIIGGTLLGAVRNRGFIPWDDDADVALLRSDYEAFLNACEQDLDSERFYVQDRFRTEGYRWGYGKLRRRNTSFIRSNTEHMPYEQGVYIDIMPLDYVPNSRAGQLFCSIIAYFFRKASWSEVGKRTEGNYFCKTLYSLVALIPFPWLNQAYQTWTDRLNRRPTEYLSCLSVPLVTSKGHRGHWRYRSEWLMHLIEYEFEGYSLMGIRDFDLALRRKYGEYREPVRFSPVSLSSCRLLPLEEIEVEEGLKEAVQMREVKGMDLSDGKTQSVDSRS